MYEDRPIRPRRKVPMLPQPAEPDRRSMAIGIGAALVIVAMLALITSQLGTPMRPIAPPRSTAAPALFAAPPSPIPHPPTPAEQDAYDAPGGALLGPIPLDVVLTYQHSAWPGWAGVAWHGGIVWVHAEPPMGAIDLAEPVRVAAPVYAPPPPPAIVIENAAPPRLDPTLDPAVLAMATQQAADGLATAYAVQTAEARYPTITPVAVQQVR